MPSSGTSVPAPAADTAAAARVRAGASHTELQAQVAVLNKFLNDSGRPSQFRVDPSPGSTLIQEINPANGEVVADYPAISFPELARSLGISGAVINRRA